MKKNIYFLAGLPRSGSTLLAAILNQHPLVRATSTSGLIDVLIGVIDSWDKSVTISASTDTEANNIQLRNVLRTVCDAMYDHIDKPIILDKARGWSSSTNIQTMTKILGHKPKIVATVRNIPDCTASFVRISDPENKYEFLKTHSFIEHVKESYQCLETGYRFAPDCILFVDYDDLVEDPSGQLERVHKFLDLPDHEYDFENLDGTDLREKDEEVWTVKGLHDIKPKLEFQHKEDPRDVLGHMYYDFVQPRFWLGERVSDKPISKLDLQLAASIMGNFHEGSSLSEELEKEEPWNDRAAFNRGWYKMRQGMLLEGEKLLFRGRSEGVFGNPVPNTPTPLWDGVSSGTVILNLEGGLGDQIHGARYVKYLKQKGCEVIVACSGPLATVFRQMDDVKVVIQSDVIYGVVHDYWIPSMSSVVALGLEYKDIDGSAYIKKPQTIPNKKMRIGLRWQGNPAFEHEQHRLFNPQLLFDAVKNIDADFISLQRDEGSQECPEWVQKVSLNTWDDTQYAIASCDLVISSCTSVAHLAGAMGVQTWIVVPVLPYYLWAKPGKTTPWYDSVTLFRQEMYGEWSAPFKNINMKLVEMQNK
jgi:hypothetical protein